MVSLTISLDWREWGIGIVVSFPHASRSFRNNVKFRTDFELTAWLGPLQFNAGGERTVTSYVCVSCKFEQTGEPAFIGPIPGIVFCEDCLANHRPAQLDYNAELGFVPCDHRHEDEGDDDDD